MYMYIPYTWILHEIFVSDLLFWSNMSIIRTGAGDRREGLNRNIDCFFKTSPNPESVQSRCRWSTRSYLTNYPTKVLKVSSILCYFDLQCTNYQIVFVFAALVHGITNLSANTRALFRDRMTILKVLKDYLEHKTVLNK